MYLASEQFEELLRAVLRGRLELAVFTEKAVLTCRVKHRSRKVAISVDVLARYNS